jgi:hypothetical protein
MTAEVELIMRYIPKLLGNVGFSKTMKQLYSRHRAAGLVILVQGFITKKMVASRLALRELR